MHKEKSEQERLAMKIQELNNFENELLDVYMQFLGVTGISQEDINARFQQVMHQLTNPGR